jgi:mannose-6-phosphate isomerase-like protein (cupin superfamily)
MAYTVKNLDDVKDMAPGHGLDKMGEARFCREDLGAENTGLSHQRLNPGQRQPFGHSHNQAEEIYLVLSGSGRVKLDDEIVEVKRLDAIRVSPETTRAFEAGPEGLEFVAVGPHFDKDGEVVQGWWAG